MYEENRRKTGEPILRFSKVTKKFGNKTILHDISFDIYAGELFGLIGQSGAGKTTLLRTLIGYYKPDEGSILYKGTNITNKMNFIRKIFGFSTQDSCFYEDLTLSQNLSYFGEMYGLTKTEVTGKTEHLLKLVELWEDRNLLAKQLSGGMQRRLDLAIGMIHDPEILILDEPTSGLDPILRKSMWSLIKKINQLGVTIIMSSHLLDEMEHLCRDVAMIKNGTLLVKGSPNQLKTYYSKHQEVWIESYPGNYKRLIEEVKNRNIAVFYPRHEGNKLVFYTPDTYSTLRVLPLAATAANEGLSTVKIEKPTLNEVFEALTRYNK